MRGFLSPIRYFVVAGIGMGLFATGEKVGWGKPSRQDDNQENPVADEDDGFRTGYRIRVPLPVTRTIADKLEQQINLIKEEAPLEVKGNRRPVLILEFDTRSASGQGSDFSTCFGIALLLTDPKLSSLHTVAYIPEPKPAGFQDNLQPTGQLKGHAVLIALACNEIAMHEQASIGEAGIDLSGDLAVYRSNYDNIVGRRSPQFQSIAQAMLDPDLTLSRVKTVDQTKFVLQAELDQLERSGKVINTSTICHPESLLTLSSAEMQQYRFIRYRVSSLRELAQRFDLDPISIEGDPSAGGEWQAVQISLGPDVNHQSVSWAIRLLNEHLDTHPTNLIIIRISADGGDLQDCIRLSQKLASFDSEELRTVAFVEQDARGPSSLVALACDQVLMSENARLGGPGIVELTDEDLFDAEPLIKKLAAQKERDWSLFQAFVDPSVTISRWRNKTNGQIRLMSEEEHAELKDAEDWRALEALDVSEGILSKKAETLSLSQATLESFEQLKAYYQLTESPTDLRPTASQRWIESVTQRLASPGVAFLLLFGAVFFLSTESSSPGIGVPGFLGSVCLLLFFWSQYLDGNAHWLEILLFFVGLIFLALEIFVIPGFGIFGIGGLVMIVISIVLASQTFIIPRNSEELARLPVSLSMVVAASGGFLTALFVIRRFLPTMPMFQRLMLPPPGSDSSVSPTQRSKRESLVDRSHLEGRIGVTKTPLVPAGKAQIGSELVDVISDGRMIEPDTNVKVIEVTGNRVLVQPTDTT